jgi:hypothetical protein
VTFQFICQYFYRNVGLAGGTIKSRVGVAGDSGGGNIAASVCHDCRNVDFQVGLYSYYRQLLKSKQTLLITMILQVLVYPHVSARGDFSLASYEEYKSGPLIDRETINW